MEKKVEIEMETGVTMDKKMETTIVYRGYMVKSLRAIKLLARAERWLELVCSKLGVGASS